MRGLEPKHYALLAGFLASLSVALAGVKGGWGDVLTPLFMAGVLMQVSTLIGALYAGAPGATGEMTDRRNPEQLPVATGVSGISPVKDPGRLGSWLLVAALAGGSTVFIACTPPPKIVTAPGKAAYKADQVLDRLKEISGVVQDGTGTKPGQIRPADAFTIIEWISGDQKHRNPATGAIESTIGIAQIVTAAGEGQGWKAAARSGWESRIRPIFERYAALSPYIGIVDAILEVF